jgi:hypothetical protein
MADDRGDVEHEWYTPTIEERVAMHLEDQTHTLYVCPNAWALRRRVVNEETGETHMVRCGSWSCLYCGPRKVNEWRQLIAEAEPTLHLVLTKAGGTVEEAARALTTFMQALRRGSKGRGRSHVGARPAYPVEYFAVLERHANFEENGFHWHVLLKGVEAIPYETIKELWRSARHGEAENGWIQRIQNSKAIGYVTKYLTKDIFRQERGVKQVERVATGLYVDEEGRLAEAREVVIDEVESRARRIRYSRGFFPESTKELRARLFSSAEQGQEEAAREDEQAVGEEEQADEPQQGASPWRLKEICPVVGCVREYVVLLRASLKEVITERVANGRRLSRRVLSVWNYQQEQVYGKPLKAWEGRCAYEIR